MCQKCTRIHTHTHTRSQSAAVSWMLLGSVTVVGVKKRREAEEECNLNTFSSCPIHLACCSAGMPLAK